MNTTMPAILYVSVPPRAGSTLLCQLLDLHPQIDSPSHSSPLLENPLGTLNTLWQWLGLSRHDLPRHDFDTNQLPVKPHESDSRFKYPHVTHRTVRPHTPHRVAPRIKAEIHKNCRWFYKHFYPEQLWLQGTGP
ncbi:hypothetical protein CCP4SC76_3010031 [Gammaproteobacteria bacterium]